MTTTTPTAVGREGADEPQRRGGPRTPRWPLGSRRIRFGGDYNPEQWPREVWLEDLALMQEAGVDLVSLGIFSWVMLEPRPGVYEFGQMDTVMDLLAGAGIGVDLGTPTAAPPAWFWALHPDERPVTRAGVVLGHGARGMASPSGPAYRDAATGIVEQLALRYRDHPALAMWHVHNEYGAPVGESYDEHSVLAFRRWLQDSYGSLDAVNDAWGTTFWGQRYGEWAEIDAPRLAATTVNQGQRLDFARFTSDALLRLYVAERDVIRRYTPELAVTTNFMATNCLTLDYWKWAREVDVVANDHYLAAERTDNHVLLSLDADLTRSLAGGDPWMLMEHSTSAVNWQPRNLAKRPGELERNSLAHLGRGADAIMFFQFRASRYGAEKFHSAMLPHAGPDSRVWREVVDLGHDLDDLAEVRGSRVRVRVAILWDWESFWAQDLEWRPSEDLDHRARIVEYYTALWRRGVTVDFAHPDADLGAYDLVVAPSSYLLTRQAGENLAGFVRRGGQLVVSYGAGLVDEHDAVHPGGFPGPLADTLGLRVEEFLPFRDGESAPLRSGGTGRIWADDIVLAGAEAIDVFTGGRAVGQPAVTRHRLQNGDAWYISTTLDDATLDQLLGSILDTAGIPSEALPAGLELVERNGDDATYRFLLNHTDRPIALPARLDGGPDLLGVLTDGERRSIPPQASVVFKLPTQR
jgi:beta-galactosidase